MSSVLNDAITFECKENGTCAYKISFRVPAAAVEAELKTAAKEAGKYARIPGFRPGKAPASLVMNRYREYILEDAERAMQRAAFEKVTAGKDIELDILAFGRMDAEKKPEAGQDYAFTLDVETAPEIKPADFKSIKIDLPESDSVEKRTADRLAYLRQLYAEYKPLDGKVVSGDMLKVSYESDFALPENASPALTRAVKADDAWLHIAEPEQIPGMNAALTGGEKGGEYSFAAAFPADWRQEELRGKTVNFKVKIHDGQHRVELTDDKVLAEKTGVESVEKLMENIRKTAEYERENEIRGKVKEEMLRLVLEKTPEFPLPQGMLGNATQREFSNLVNRLVRTEADVETFKKDQEKHLEEAKKAAEEYLRRFLIIRCIAKANGITVSDAEVDAQIRLMSAYTGRKEEEIRKTLGQSGRESEIQEDILMNKTLDFMVEGICGKKEER